MDLKIVSLNDRETWDSIVRSFKSYDTYWLSGYAKAFMMHGDGEALLFYFDDGSTRGINVVMKRDIAEDTHFRGKIEKIPAKQYFDFITPYGYGGWLIEGDCNSILKEYEKWCRKNNIVSEFVRFHPLISNYEIVKNYYEVIPLGETVSMDIRSPEIVWENMSSKNRNVIRKAVKNGVEIYNGRFPEIFKQFKIIYDATMRRDNAEEYYYFESDFYNSILADLPQNAQIFWAEKDGIVIAASIMLECNGFMNYHLSGLLQEYSSLAPTNLLLYKAALWGCAHGCKTLYLGGGVGSGEDNLFKFKKAFYKGELQRFHIGHKVFNSDVYEELVMMRMDNIKNVDFFPVYRG